MYKSKLFELYQTLDKSSIRLFKKWIYSPVHNDHIYIQKIFEYIFSRRTLTATTLKKERVWKHLYTDETYDDLRLRHIMSLALDVLEEFVRYNQSKKDLVFQEKGLAHHYFEQGLEKRGYKTLEATKLLLDENPTNELYFLHQYELEVLLFERTSKQSRTGTTNLTAIIDNARLFFMMTTLKYAYIALTHQNLRKVEYEVPLLGGILEEIQSSDYSQYPILLMYYHAYFTLKNPENIDHFIVLKGYLEKNKIEGKELRSALLVCLNYAIKRINIGDLEYAREAFELYRYGLQNGCLLENNMLSAFAYKNIVTLGLNLKEFDWIEHFIASYSSFLPEYLRSNYKHYNTSKLVFERGDFDQAIELLVQVEYDDLILNIGAKVMLLKIYYQEQNYDALDALLDSFRIFLQRKKVLAYHKVSYMNLISFVKKLLLIKPDKASKNSLKNEIEATKQLSERKWLLTQL